MGMPLPEDEADWAALDVVFATTSGTVRRNKLSDFADVRPSGIIAMKLEDGEAIVDVQICTEKDDVLLTANGGQCIRFAVPEVRVFQGRTSRGVRGITLAEKDHVISMSILRHVDVSAEERAAYHKRASAVRRGAGDEPEPAEAEEGVKNIELGEKRYVELSAAEQFVLTVSERGFGKRSSSYEYRTTGRGGKGIVAMTLTKKTGKIVGSFPVEEADQVMTAPCSGLAVPFALGKDEIRKAAFPFSDSSHKTVDFRLPPDDWSRLPGKRFKAQRPRPCEAAEGGLDPGLCRESPFTRGHSTRSPTAISTWCGTPSALRTGW